MVVHGLVIAGLPISLSGQLDFYVAHLHRTVERIDQEQRWSIEYLAPAAGDQEGQAEAAEITTVRHDVFEDGLQVLQAEGSSIVVLHHVVRRNNRLEGSNGREPVGREQLGELE